MTPEVNRTSKLVKSAKQLVYCVVAEPEVEDLQGDILSADEIEKMAHGYMLDHRVIFDSHTAPAAAAPVESFIAPVDMEVEGEQIKKGSWVLTIKVQDPELWAAIEKGLYNGVSIGGSGVRTPLDEKKV